MIRMLKAAPLALLLAAAPAAAQDSPAAPGPSFWDMFRPEAILQRVLQIGIISARGYADIVYGDMVVNPLAGQVTISDLKVWPLPPWDEAADCVIAADRAVIRSQAVDEPGRLRFKLQLWGATAPGACLPQGPRGALEVAGLDGLDLPWLTLDVSYDVASGGALVHLYAPIRDFAALDVTADFDYLAVDMRYDPDEPAPLVSLRYAAATVENLGGWDRLRSALPPPLVMPDQGPAVIQGGIGQAMAQANAAAAPDRETGDDAPAQDPSALSPEQRAFAESLGAAWGAFLADPRKLVVETGFDPAEPVFLSFELYKDDPRVIFEELAPVAGLAAGATRDILPAQLLQRALTDDETLDAADRRRAGLALVTGDGAPRNVTAGLAILEDLATADGGAEAALALSDALAPRDPEAAYMWALRAGEGFAEGAASRLDRLEATLPFARVLALQDQALGQPTHPLAALERVTLIRTEAALRLSGIGRLRSYRTAAMWAMLAAAAGDAEAQQILADLDERVRLSGGAARAAWTDVETAAGALAMEVWISQDLPARFATP